MVTEGHALREFIDSEKLLSQLRRIAEVSEQLWRKDTVFHRYFTLHGVKHSANLLENFANLIPNDLKAQLNETELTLLASAAWTHDLGMLYFRQDESPDDDDDVRRVRQTHHIRSEEFMLSNDFPQLSGVFDDRESRALAELCKSHGMSDIGSLKPRWLSSDVELRMGLLAALLRLADVCDVTYQRDGLLFRLLFLDEESLPHWAQLQFIDTVTLEPTGQAFELWVRGRVPERKVETCTRLVETMAVRWIRAEIGQSRPVLARYGFFIVDVVPDLHPDSSLDRLPFLDDLDALFEVDGPLYEPIVSAADRFDDVQFAILRQISSKARTADTLARTVNVAPKYIVNSVRGLTKAGLIEVERRGGLEYVALSPSGTALVWDMGLGQETR